MHGSTKRQHLWASLLLGFLVVLLAAWWVHRTFSPGGVADVGSTRSDSHAPDSQAVESEARPISRELPSTVESVSAGRPLLDDDLIAMHDQCDGTRLAGGELMATYLDGEQRRVLADSVGVCRLGKLDEVTSITIAWRDYFPVELHREEIKALPEMDGVRRLDLRRGGRVIVQVVTPDGGPVHGAYVSARPYDPHRLEGTARLPRIWPAFDPPNLFPASGDRLNTQGGTDTNGTVVIPFLPRNEPLAISASGKIPIVSQRVLIPCDGELPVFRIVAPQSSLVVGKLEWSDGEPASGVRIEFSGDRFTRSDRSVVTTSRTGEFRCEGRSIRNQAFHIDLAGERMRSFSVDGATTDLGTIVLERRRALRGRVVIPEISNDEDYGRLRVEVWSKGDFLSTAPVLPGSGEFEIGATLSECELLFQIFGFDVAAIPISVQEPDQVVDLGPHASALAFDCPEEHAQDELVFRFIERGNRGWSFQVESNPNEAAEADAPRPMRRLLQVLPPGTFAIDIRVRNERIAYHSSVELAPGSMFEMSTLMRGRATLHGRVVSPSGVPCPGVEVQARPQPFWGRVDRGYCVTARSDEKGEFEFQGIQLGTWRVFPAKGGVRHRAAVNVELAETGVSPSVEIVLAGKADLGGIVRLDGVPQAGVRVLAAPRGTQWNPEEMQSTETDTDGGFEFDAMPFATYCVILGLGSESPTNAEHVRTVELESEEGARVEFDLTRRKTQVVLEVERTAPAIDVLDAFFPGGYTTLRLWPRHPVEAELQLGTGPWLFAWYPVDTGGVRTPGAPNYYIFSTAGRAGEKAGSRLVVRPALGTLRLAVQPGWSLPDAALFGLDGTIDPLSTGSSYPVRRSTDPDGSTVVFHHLPAKAKLWLSGLSKEGKMHEKLWTMTTDGEERTTWP